MSADADPMIATDELGRRILATLRDEGGKAESTDLRNDLGGVDRDRFNYRVREHLKPAGAVETQEVDADVTHLPPNELILTDIGRKYLQQLDEEDGLERSVSDRVDQLEQRVDDLQRENQELQEQNRELREALERSNAAGLEDELQTFRANIDSLQARVRAVEENPVVASNVAPGAIDTGLILGNTCKKLLEQILDEKTVEQKRVEMKEGFQDDGHLLAE
jgi:chaperonin cofactor prefoldin